MFCLQVNVHHELRILEPCYADELFNLTDTNRSYLRQWLPWVDSVKTCSDTLSFIESTMQQFTDKRGFVAGIWYESSLVGVIGYEHLDRVNRSTYLGYWLAESYQGRGIMTDSCKVFINYAFNSLKLNRVVIACASNNSRSHSVAERLGFAFEGVMREAEWLYDHYVDLAVYSQLQHQWRGQST